MICRNQKLLGSNTKPLNANPSRRPSFLPLCVTLVLCRGSGTSSSVQSQSRALMEAGANLGREVTRLLGERLSALQNHPRAVMLIFTQGVSFLEGMGISAPHLGACCKLAKN